MSGFSQHSFQTMFTCDTKFEVLTRVSHRTSLSVVRFPSCMAHIFHQAMGIQKVPGSTNLWGRQYNCSDAKIHPICLTSGSVPWCVKWFTVLLETFTQDFDRWVIIKVFLVHFANNNHLRLTNRLRECKYHHRGCFV